MGGPITSAVWNKRVRIPDTQSSQKISPGRDGAGPRRYAYAWVVDEVAGHRVVWHNGGIDGFGTSYWRVPDADLVVVAWTNVEGVAIDPVSKAAVLAALGGKLEPQAPDKPGTLDRALVERVAGTYTLTDDSKAKLTALGAPQMLGAPSRLAGSRRNSYYLRVSGIAEQNEAHRRFGAVYFTELSVAGVRCFGPEQRLSLGDGGRAAKWTVILGENGVGKTTLLQCAWAMAPCVSEAQPGALGDGSHPRGFPGQARVLRRAATSSMSIRAEVVVDEPLTSAKLGTTLSTFIESAVPTIEQSGSYLDWANAVCCGYGALRRSGEASVEAGASGHSAARRVSSHHRSGDLHAEQPLFVDPGSEDPTAVIEFRREYAAPVEASARGAATIDALQLNRSALAQRRREHRQPLLAIVILLAKALRTGISEEDRGECAPALDALITAAAEDAEYASMIRSLLRHVAPWRDNWAPPVSSLLDALEADTAGERLLHVNDI